MQSSIASFISPLLSTPLSTIDKVNSKISSLASFLYLTVSKIIPKFRQKRKTKLYIHDDAITQKCHTSKQAWKLWRDVGRPRFGPLFNSMKAKYEDKSYIRSLRATQERRKLQARDVLFKNKDEKQFYIHRKQTKCRKLIVDGEQITTDSDLLYCWKNHFEYLSQTATAVAILTPVSKTWKRYLLDMRI